MFLISNLHLVRKDPKRIIPQLLVQISRISGCCISWTGQMNNYISTQESRRPLVRPRLHPPEPGFSRGNGSHFRAYSIWWVWWVGRRVDCAHPKTSGNQWEFPNTKRCWPTMPKLEAHPLFSQPLSCDHAHPSLHQIQSTEFFLLTIALGGLSSIN